MLPLRGFLLSLRPKDAQRRAKLLYTVHGMRTAASSWEKECTKTLVEAGLPVGSASGCNLFHPNRQIRSVAHGGYFVAAGDEMELEFVKQVFSKK